jgi:methionine aminopeptidase
MDSAKFNKYQQAAEIVNKTLKKAKELCNEKQNASYICIFCDSMMKELLSKLYKKSKKGISIPTCLSINEIVAHDSYSEKNDYKLQDGDIIRIELACHIDDSVASVGDTIKVGDNEWDKSKLMLAAQKAMEVGIMGIYPNQPITNFMKNLEKVAKCFNLNLVKRPNVFHEYDTTILFDWAFRDSDNFNEPSWVVVKDHELELEDEELSEDIDKNLDFTIGEAYHMTVAFTTSQKKANVSNKTPAIYQNTINRYTLKTKAARELLNNVTKQFDTECFKLSDINMNEASAKLGMRECLNHGVLRSLGLIELKNSETVLLKCSFIVQDNSIYKLTGEKIKDPETCDFLTTELNNILKENIKFSKRLDYLSE